MADKSRSALLVGQCFSRRHISTLWQDHGIAHLKQVGQQFVLDIVLRMNKGRCDGGGCLHHLVAYKIYGLARAVSTRGQHLGSTYRNLHLGDNLALLVFNLEDTALVTFHYLIHAVGDGTHSYSILNGYSLHRADKQVGLAGNPLLAALGLDAL